MGSALLRGILKSKLSSPDKITVVDVVPNRLEELRSLHGVRVSVEPGAYVGGADAIILAVKPQALHEVVESIRNPLTAHQLVISILAGVASTYIRDLLGMGNPVIRVMPNIGATVDAAASALAGCEPSTEEHFQLVEAILGAVGEVVRVDEEHLDAVTGLSGSGPAYIYMIIEALCDGGVNMGLPRGVALKLATQTVLGAAKLVRESGEHPAILRDRVTTPGGTTIAAIRELEGGGLRAMIMKAVSVATTRSKELSLQVREQI